MLTLGHLFDLQPGWSQVQTEVGSESFSSSQSSLQNLRPPSTMQVQVWCAHFFSSVLTGSAISTYLLHEMLAPLVAARARVGRAGLRVRAVRGVAHLLRRDGLLHHLVLTLVHLLVLLVLPLAVLLLPVLV